MESNHINVRVTLQILEARIIKFVNARIRNGEYTERGLAKALGISQPQIHNVLKGARTLRTDLADRILLKFELSVLDLLKSSEVYELMLKRGTIIVETWADVEEMTADVLPRRRVSLPAKMPPRKATPKRRPRLSGVS